MLPALLLHGLCRTNRSMIPIQRFLTRAGYQVTNPSYPSRRFPIEILSRRYLAPILTKLQKPKPTRLCIVTHSMGGILIRHWLSENQPQVPFRIVMIAPPNQGSEIVDSIGHWPLFKWLNGPAGQQLGTQSLPSSLPQPTQEIGIIAGSRSINWINSLCYLPGDDDGKVTIASTQLPGATDHRTIAASHPMILHKTQTFQLTLKFLANGRF